MQQRVSCLDTPEKITIVPMADLYAQYLTIKTAIDAAIAEVIRASTFIRGPHVELFERAFAELIGTRFCISCANGTDAIYIVLRALNLRPGDEVVTTAHSWIATSETITQAGGKVVFCDTDEHTFNIDPDRIESLVTPRTVGIVPVHLYGHPAPMGRIMEVAERHGLWVIEDCAQAHLATLAGRKIGTFGVAATFSFYPGKNLGAMGDAGAITTNDGLLADKMAMFARHGGLQKGEHQIEGINSRLDGLQAAILNVKLRHICAWTETRRRIAQRYSDRLGKISGIQVPRVAPDCTHVFHLYVILHEQRDALAAHLKRCGIQTGVNYPVALPFLEAYSRYAHRAEDFPVAYSHQSRILSIPIFPEMTDKQFECVVAAIEQFQLRQQK